MARSHHRKKHKQQLQQFKQSRVMTTDSARNKVAARWAFGIAGAILGFAIIFFATGSSLLWGTIGLIPCAIAAYFVGKKIEVKKNNS
ncbi:MAG: hypothetical protein ACRDEB_04270 [Chitinophagaceae bacterium]